MTEAPRLDKKVAKESLVGLDAYDGITDSCLVLFCVHPPAHVGHRGRNVAIYAPPATIMPRSRREGDVGPVRPICRR